MALITLLDAQLAYGHVALLDHAGFSLETAERVGLIGRNGTGKSSMLKILGGMEKPDDGSVQVQNNIRIAYVAQEPMLDADATIFEAVREGLSRVIGLIEEYCQGHGDLDAMQSEIEALDDELDAKFHAQAGRRMAEAPRSQLLNLCRDIALLGDVATEIHKPLTSMESEVSS